MCMCLSGMILNVEVYATKHSGVDNRVDHLVSRLLDLYKGKGHEVYMDRRYSRPLLFKQLVEAGFPPVGTVV